MRAYYLEDAEINELKILDAMRELLPSLKAFEYNVKVFVPNSKALIFSRENNTYPVFYSDFNNLTSTLRKKIGFVHGEYFYIFELGDTYSVNSHTFMECTFSKIPVTKNASGIYQYSGIYKAEEGTLKFNDTDDVAGFCNQQKIYAIASRLLEEFIKAEPSAEIKCMHTFVANKYNGGKHIEEIPIADHSTPLPKEEE